MQFRLSTLIWIVSVSAACLATWRYNVIYAPRVARPLRPGAASTRSSALRLPSLTHGKLVIQFRS